MQNLSRSFFIFAVVQVILFCIGFSASGIGLGGLMGAESNSDINFGNNLVIYGGVLAILAVVLFVLAQIGRAHV